MHNNGESKKYLIACQTSTLLSKPRLSVDCQYHCKTTPCIEHFPGDLVHVKRINTSLPSASFAVNSLWLQLHGGGQNVATSCMGLSDCYLW